MVIYTDVPSSCPGRLGIEISTDDSESDALEKDPKNIPMKRNAFGEAKTSRYNRPPRDKKCLEKREKIATRRSRRIKQILDEKNKLDEVIIATLLLL